MKKINGVKIILNRLILFAILFLNLSSYCQTIDSLTKYRILDNLTKQEDFIHGIDPWAAAERVVEYKMYEAIPILENNIWKHDCAVQLAFLYAIVHLNSPNAHSLALAFLDSVDHYDISKFLDTETPLGVKAEVNEILFMLNDYSKVDHIIQQLRIQPFDVTAIWLVSELLKHKAQYMEEVKNILLNAANNADKYWVRFVTVRRLEEIYGAEMLPIYLKFFKDIEGSEKEGDSYARIESFEFLCKYDYSGLEKVIKEQLYIEPASSYKINFIDTLLSRFGKPENIVFIKE